MILTSTSEGLTVQLTWTEARNLIAAIHVDAGDAHGLDDNEQDEMIDVVRDQDQWITEVVTELNDALAKAGKRSWAKDRS